MAALTRIFQKRIENEMKILKKDPLFEIDIKPDETDIRTWYFLIRGPDDSDYKNGWYIGKLVLSENYPTTPVDFYMITPNGRFLTDKKICLTISSYHSDQWSPIWSIQKILGAFLTIMTSDYDTGISHIKETQHERELKAKESLNFNIKHYPDILKKFNRFINYDQETNTISYKTKYEIENEMPKKKDKKDKDKDKDKKNTDMNDLLKNIKITN